MSTEITFRAGEFQAFKARMKFHLGPLQRDVEQGEELEFDGTMLRMPTGETHSMPKLRSVIKAGWLVKADQEDVADYRPQPAGIKVRPADDLKAKTEGRTDKIAMSTVDQEERVVVSRIGTQSGAQIGNNRIAEAYPGSASATVTGGTLGAQGGKVIGGIKSASGAAVGAEGEAVGRGTVEVTASNIGRLRSEQRKREEQFGNRQIVSSTPQGVDVADILEKEDPDAAARLRERRAAAKASEAKVGGHPNDKKEAPSSDDDEGEGLEVLWDAGEAEPEQPKAKLKPKGATEAEKKEAADFTWDKTRHWSKRVEDAVENYASKPRLLRKILAIETPTVAEKIEAKLDELGL